MPSNRTPTLDPQRHCRRADRRACGGARAGMAYVRVAMPARVPLCAAAAAEARRLSDVAGRRPSGRGGLRAGGDDRRALTLGQPSQQGRERAVPMAARFLVVTECTAQLQAGQPVDQAIEHDRDVERVVRRRSPAMTLPVVRSTSATWPASLVEAATVHWCLVSGGVAVAESVWVRRVFPAPRSMVPRRHRR